MGRHCCVVKRPQRQHKSFHQPGLWCYVALWFVQYYNSLQCSQYGGVSPSTSSSHDALWCTQVLIVSFSLLLSSWCSHKHIYLWFDTVKLWPTSHDGLCWHCNVECENNMLTTFPVQPQASLPKTKPGSSALDLWLETGKKENLASATFLKQFSSHTHQYVLSLEANW